MSLCSAGVEIRNTILKRQHVRMDKRKKYFVSYNQREEVRKRKGERSAEKMRKMILDTKHDEENGRKYKSGMAGPSMKKLTKAGKQSKW